MKLLNLLIVFFILSLNVSAIQDVNLTFDSMDTGLCLAIENVSNYVCYSNQTLILDGTQDYSYILIQRPYEIENSSRLNYNDTMKLIIFPLVFFGGGVTIFAFIIIMVIMLYTIYKIVIPNKK